MTKSNIQTKKNYQLKVDRVEEKPKSNLNLATSLITLRIVGYGLLILWLFDIAEVLYPLQFLNAAWGFQILGQFVERIGVLLIGLSLVFIGETNARIIGELTIVKCLSWFTLLLAIIYFFMIPFGISNTVRIYRDNESQITAELQQNINQFKQLEQEIALSKNQQQLQEFLKNNQSNNNSTDLPNLSIANLKQQANTKIKEQINLIQLQAQQVRREKKVNLIKRSLKWNIGALLSGIFLLLIWGNNSWIKQIKINTSRKKITP